jgi:RimJ/RimL family protein N-acetyltransferase
MISIRPVVEDDAAAIVALLDPIIGAGIWTAMTDPVSVDEQLDFIRTFPKRGLFLAAVMGDGRIVGIQDIVPGADSDLAEISTFVAVDVHRQGIGSALVRETCRAAMDLGFERIRAVIRADNPQALRFYRKEGFRDVERAGDKVIAELGGERIQELGARS